MWVFLAFYQDLKVEDMLVLGCLPSDVELHYSFRCISLVCDSTRVTVVGQFHT